MNPIRNTQHAMVAMTIGLGLAVTACPAVAQADDKDSSAANPPSRQAISDHDTAPRSKAGQRRAAGTTAKPTAPAGLPRTIRPAAAALSGSATASAANPFDGLAAALATINREINRLFFNHTPSAHPLQYGPSVPAVATGTVGGSDPEDDHLAYSVTQAPTGGSVVIDDTGAYTYTAGTELASTGGVDTFMVSVRDTGFHFNFWTPTSISVLVSVTVSASTRTPPTTLTPGLSITDVSTTEPPTGAIAPGFLHTSGNQIVDSTGHPVQIAGVNWFGLESSTGAPHGLWTRSYKDMIDQMAAAGFNTIRLPFASETLHSTATPNGIDFTKNPDLQGLTSIQIMDAVIDYAGQRGMRVILDHHRSGYGSGTSGNGLWYDSQYTEDAWVADWATLAARYQDNPTVIGVDLHNEPYAGTWGGGGATDWARAAERAGNAALAANPNLLVFVEGVADYQGQSYWWGGNLAGVTGRPITLSVPNRVVYSPHDYPNSVYPQPWFQTADFGAALPAKFRQMWGYIYENNIAPVYLGEFGTKLQDPKDSVWFEAITSYLSGDLDNNGTVDIAAGTEDMSWTYWAWNPNSGDTGGILADDWNTINQNKMDYLTPIEFSGAAPSTATFTVTLSAPSDQQVAVHYATTDGTATAGADYAGASGTVTFAPGETHKTITISVLHDSLTEADETFTVIMSNPTGATLVDAMGLGTITGTMPPAGGGGDFVDLMTFGMFHGSSHTGMDALEGGRTAITTEALLAYNDLRAFHGLAPATLEDVGRWAFAHNLTNNPQPWDNDLQGVGLYYAMQGAKVGWIADAKYAPVIVADIERTARLGSADDVMALVAAYGQNGFAQYLMDNGYDTAFIDTLQMEPHYAGWMHDRANGRLVIEGAATAHDVNHLTVLSHDQTTPFMNDTWDWPQWPALNVSNKRVIEYFQSMVALGDPLGSNLG